MPLYEYHCADCGPFARSRPVAERDRPAECPLCQGAAERLVSAPNLSLMSSVRRRAHSINEKSRHEPGLRQSHRCGSGCGCGQKGKSSPNGGQSGSPARLQAGRKNNRPWMLGH